MPKYTESNVLKIKKDIQRYSVVLSDVVKQCEEEQTKLKRLRQESEAEVERVNRLGNQMAMSIQARKVIIGDLNQEITNLRADKSVIESQLSLWTRLLAETIKKLQLINEKKDDSFLKSLVREGANLLLNMSKKKEAERIYLENLKKEKEVLELNNSILKKQETAVRNQVESLNTQIKSKNDALINLEKQKQEIERRDYDSKVMAIRLTKEYQDVYFNRKK